MEVRICCRLVTQVLTLWPVGAIGWGADPLGITPHTSSFIPETEHEGFTLLYPPLSAAHLSSHSSAEEVHDQDNVSKGLQEPRSNVTQAPYNVPGPGEGIPHTTMPSERERAVSNHTISALISSTHVPSPTTCAGAVTSMKNQLREAKSSAMRHAVAGVDPRMCATSLVN